MVLYSRSVRTDRRQYAPCSAPWQEWRDVGMDEYRVLNVLMILFSSQIVNTYLHAFHNTKKKNYLKWFAWGAYGLFQYQVMVSTAGMPLLILIINIGLVFSIYKFSYHVDTKTALVSFILSGCWLK